MELILRDKLAIDRTHLANERTLLSYLRTSLYLIIFSLVIFSETELLYVSLSSITLSSVIAVVGLFRYNRTKRRINNLYK